MLLGRWNQGSGFPDMDDYQIYGNLLTNEKFLFFEQNGSQVYFIGKIFNLKTLGYDKDSNAAEVLWQIFSKDGYKGFSQLDGGFIGIIYIHDTVILVRDHHGISHQIYYTESYFASSLGLLQRTPGFETIPNYKELSKFLNIGYVGTPGSSIMGVKKLGAGEVLIVKKSKIERINLFPTNAIEPAGRNKSLDEYAEQYGELHKNSIRRRIEGAQNVGLLLSGGYDSGCNLAGLRQIYSGKVSSYSIGFKGDSWTELPLARCMSDTFGTVHSEYEIDGSEITYLPEIVDYLGDPFVEGGLMVNYMVMRLIGNDKPEVILGGDGSDQYFGTSGREVAIHYLASRYGVKPLSQMVYSLMSSASFDKDNKLYRIRFHLGKILEILQGDTFGFPRFHLKQLLQDQSALPVFDKLKPDIRSFEHLYTQHLYKSDIEKIINQVILFKASRMASLFDNNLTYPYMDLDLYRFLMQLPVYYKCKGENARAIAKGEATAKFLLKYHYKPMLPEAITAKKKQGGFAPMPLFFKEDKQRARTADYILSSSMLDTFLKRDTVEAFLRRYDTEVHYQGSWFWYKQNRAIQYFYLLTLAIWWERFIEGKNSSFD